MRINTTSTLSFLLLVTLLSFGCTKKSRPEGYRVVGYDGATRQWTVIREGTFDGKYLVKRLTLVCLFYQWGNHEIVKGSDACHLQVGRLIIPNPMPPLNKRNEFIDVFEMPSETIAITEGDGADKVSQQFDILKYEVLPDTASQ